jgi:DNA-binding GntR family transcriptional regulator
VLANLGLVSRSSHREPVVSLLTPQRAEEIYTLRALLESFAARLAVEHGRVDDAALARLRVHVDAIAAGGAGAGVRVMVEADMAFHRELSALAGHELLLEHLAAVHTHSRRLLMYSDLYRPDFEVVVKRHLDLLGVLRAGDPATVERAVSGHISEVGRTIAGRMAEIASAVPAREQVGATG